MNEPAVTLTDFALAFECAILFALVARGPALSMPKRWVMLFFAALVVAPLSGGLTHGYFPHQEDFAHIALKTLTLTSIGVGAWAAWAIGAWIVWPSRPRPRALVIASTALILLAYLGVILSGERNFLVAIVHYLPSALFLTAAFALDRVLRGGGRPAAIGLSGMLLTFVAAGVQRMGQNALYHVIQGVALALVFVALTRRKSSA